MPSTDRYSWPMPTVGGSAGTWGTELNDLFDDYIEEKMYTVETTANAAMPKAGGVFTGEIEIVTERCATVAKGNLSGAVTFDMSAAEYQWGTVTGNITSVTFSNLAASGKVEFWTIELINGGAYTITWPAAVKWDGGGAPSLQASGVDVVVFWTRDNGTTIRGALSYSNTV